MNFSYGFVFIASLFLTNTFAQGPSGAAPNMFHIVKLIADDYPNALQRADANDDSPESWEFFDRVVQKLHSIDPRFGYREFWNIDEPDHTATSFGTIAYFTGQGDPWGAREESLGFISVITPTQPRSAYWGAPDSQDSAIASRWFDLRPGAPDYGYGGVQQHQQEDQAIEGVCGPYRGESDASCLSGKFHSFRRDTETEYIWVCRDIPYEGEDICRELKPPPVCAEDQLSPFWEPEGDECLPSCGTAQSIFCQKNGCMEWSPARGENECNDRENYDIEKLVSFESPCCLRKPLPPAAPEEPAPIAEPISVVEPAPTAAEETTTSSEVVDARFSALIEEVDALTERVGILTREREDEVEALTEQVDALMGQVGVLTEQVSLLTREAEQVDALTEKVGALTGEAEQVDALAEKVGVLTGEVEELKRSNDDFFQVLEIMTVAIDELEAQSTKPSCAEAQRIACEREGCSGFLETQDPEMCSDTSNYQIIDVGETSDDDRACCLVKRKPSL